jgi:hypothetical protein
MWVIPRPRFLPKVYKLHNFRINLEWEAREPNVSRYRRKKRGRILILLIELGIGETRASRSLSLLD